MSLTLQERSSRAETAGAVIASAATMRNETPDIDIVPIRRDPLPPQWAVVADSHLVAIVGQRKDAVSIAFKLAYHCQRLSDHDTREP